VAILTSGESEERYKDLGGPDPKLGALHIPIGIEGEDSATEATKMSATNLISLRDFIRELSAWYFM
jgi:hypothetical protein